MRLVLHSKNRKLSKTGTMMSTYAKTGITCPSSCVFHPEPNEYAIEKRNLFGKVTICYTLKGNSRYHQKHLGIIDALKVRVEINKFLTLRNSQRAKGATQAKRINAIRWNVSGDVFHNGIPSVEYVDSIVWACEQLKAVGVSSLGYTHGWAHPDVQPLKNWFMASCDTEEEVLQAQEMGWMATVLLPKTGTFSKIKTAKCPNQITDGLVKCDECMLCSPDSLPKFTKRVIGFKYH